ncbi:MAG: OmpH family outer membrane protein [Desulfovibrio sp.]|nr:OmpH family outer membrane protein [Desulfovibrio sp.]
MKFKIPATALVAACLFLGGFGDLKAEEDKWAIVDIVKLMKESAPGKAGVKFIEARQAEMQKELDAFMAKLDKNPDDAQLREELQKVYASSNQRIQAEGQNVANLLLDAVKAAMDKYRVDNGYSMLIGVEALASYDPAKDVTDAILLEVNKSKLEFKPLPEADEIPAPAAAEKPAQKEAKPAKK